MTGPRKGRPQRAVPMDAPRVASDSDLEGLLAQFDNTIRGKVQRENLTLKRWEHVGNIEPVTPDFIDDVQAAYGGGNYRVRFYNGAEYVKGNGYMSFSIAGKPKDPSGDDDDRVARLERQLLERSAPPPQKSGVEWARDIAAIITPVAAALGTVIPLLKGNGGTDVVATVNMVHDAEERGERRGRTLGRLEAGTPEGGTMLDVAKAYAVPLFDLLARKGQQPPTNGAPTSAPTNGAQLTHTPNPPPMLPELPDGYAWLATLRPFYPQLAAQAQTDTDPTIIADFVLAKMDETHLQAIETASRRDDFLSTMRAELFPIHESYPDWLGDFLARIVENCAADDAPLPKAKKPKGAPSNGR